MREEGITFIELLVVVSIIGIIAVVLGFSLEGWTGNYRIESQIKEIYMDLIDARTKAMTKKRMHFVTLEATQYTIQEDIDPWPDGDEDLTAADNIRPTGYNDPIPLLQKNLTYHYQIKMISKGKMPLTITIDTRGLMTPGVAPVSFRIDNTQSPDYDCILIRQARIRMGKYNGTKCVEK